MIYKLYMSGLLRSFRWFDRLTNRRLNAPPRNDGDMYRHCKGRAWEKSLAKKSDDEQVAVIASGAKQSRNKRLNLDCFVYFDKLSNHLAMTGLRVSSLRAPGMG